MEQALARVNHLASHRVLTQMVFAALTPPSLCAGTAMNISSSTWLLVGLFVGGVPAVAVFFAMCAVRHIPNNCVGIIEKPWSPSGSLEEGQLIATDGKAGY